MIDSAKPRYRWILLAGLWLVYASFGLVVGALPPLVVYLSEDLGLSRAAMGSIMGAWPLVYIAFAIPAGALIDRKGLRLALTLGAAFIALSGFLRALSVNHLSLYLAVAVFGLGGPFISIGGPKLIGAWFGQKERGKAMGIYLTAPSLGRIVALATANGVLMPLYRSNWRLTLATYAGFAIVAGVIWWIIARGARGPAETTQGEPAGAQGGIKVFANLLRIRVVQIVLFISLGSFLFGHGLNNWLPEILRSGGMSAKQSGFWAMMPLMIGLAATLVVPRLATPRRRVPILVAALAAAAAASIIISFSTGAFLIVGLFIAGIAGRGVMPILMLTLIDSPQVGPSRMGAAGGLFFTAGEVGGVLGPLLMGVVSGATGSFSGGLLMLAGSSGFLVFLAIWLGIEVRGSQSSG
jgi:MFS transporter, CP family, cyanate transporter